MTPGEKTVMLVDDDESVRTSLARLFSSAQLPLSVFDSAEDFLARAPLDADGCLIIDVQLPGMRGLDLQTHCALHRPNLAVIIITAFDDEETEQRALGGGAVAFLRKPFDANALLQRVKSVIGR